MMQKIKILTGAIAFVILAAGVTVIYNTFRNGLYKDDIADVPPIVAEYRKISADEAKQMLDEGEDIILLDVRSDDEFYEQHIPGAILIPDYEVSKRAEVELPDKNALILIYCRSGRRSALAANELIGMGYINVYDFGGIIDWPYETEDQKEKRNEP